MDSDGDKTESTTANSLKSALADIGSGAPAPTVAAPATMAAPSPAPAPVAASRKGPRSAAAQLQTELAPNGVMPPSQPKLGYEGL